MTKTIIVAAVSMAASAALGWLICGATVKYLRRRVRSLRAASNREKLAKMGVMDKVLILEAVVLVAYSVADLAVFWHTGAEPTTLTACVFGVCGLENGVMGWIKTSKEKAGAPSGSAQGAPEAPVEREEPPDVGV
ncbi:MAG: hypothetical protein SOR90_10435 [Oscillospiraceae bacterium]|nr:hypothetical protein [Oscillospiraceae bacterium]